MTPIISPWIFYSIEVIQDMLTIIFIAWICLSIMIIIGIGVYLAESEFNSTEESINNKKILKKFLIIWLILSSINIIIPSENTIYKMVVANNITPHNIEIVGDEAKDMIDYIIDGVDKMLDEGDK